MYNQNSLDDPVIGTVHIVVTLNVPVACLKQIAFALESKWQSSQQLCKFALYLRAEPGTVKVGVPTPSI